MYFKSGFRRRKAHLRELEKLVRVEVRESGEGEVWKCLWLFNFESALYEIES